MSHETVPPAFIKSLLFGKPDMGKGYPEEIKWVSDQAKIITEDNSLCEKLGLGGIDIISLRLYLKERLLRNQMRRVSGEQLDRVSKAREMISDAIEYHLSNLGGKEAERAGTIGYAVNDLFVRVQVNNNGRPLDAKNPVSFWVLDAWSDEWHPRLNSDS